jgi:hypothetical protein
MALFVGGAAEVSASQGGDLLLWEPPPGGDLPGIGNRGWGIGFSLDKSAIAKWNVRERINGGDEERGTIRVRHGVRY